MEPLLNQLRELPKRFLALSNGVKIALLGVVGLLVTSVVVASILANGGTYQYVFTNLTPEDAAEAASQLKVAGLPFRMEAGGTALAVPSAKVYDARLLLAGSGLPRGGGVGFEIFDKGDLGVSEFTQKVNLRRATEGELARTLGRLSAVRSARVHITFAQHGLYRDEDKEASAAVVVNLQPGRTLGERELQGMRHLVSSAVPGLRAEAVTVVDGQGAVLAGDEAPGGKASDQQRQMERALERRVVELLSRAVGPEAVEAKVSVTLDSSQVESTADKYDPEGSAVRSERVTAEQTAQGGPKAGGVAGAAANQPLTNVGGGVAGSQSGSSNREDEVRNFEISKVTTHTVTQAPRVQRLSVAVLLDGVDGKPRSAEDVARLGELAKSAVGFDAARGDQFQISSTVFAQPGGTNAAAAPHFFATPAARYGGMAAAALLVGLIVVAFVLRRKKARAEVEKEVALLKPGSSVAELERAIADAQPTEALEGMPERPALADPNVVTRDRARELAMQDPERAARLLKAWIQTDIEEKAKEEEAKRAAT
ncbi:MAG: flagellar M-ring protein FliF [Myxococcales bacterium]|nr:flagellar M-ring protein FliF [Myxococcales bacterium]